MASSLTSDVVACITRWTAECQGEGLQEDATAEVYEAGGRLSIQSGSEEEGTSVFAANCSTRGKPPRLHMAALPHPSDAVMLAAAMEEILRRNLADWGAALLALQPKVHLSRHLLECGLWLFKCVRREQAAAAAAAVARAGAGRAAVGTRSGWVATGDPASSLECDCHVCLPGASGASTASPLPPFARRFSDFSPDAFDAFDPADAPSSLDSSSWVDPNDSETPRARLEAPDLASSDVAALAGRGDPLHALIPSSLTAIPEFATRSSAHSAPDRTSSRDSCDTLPSIHARAASTSSTGSDLFSRSRSDPASVVPEEAGVLRASSRFGAGGGGAGDKGAPSRDAGGEVGGARTLADAADLTAAAASAAAAAAAAHRHCRVSSAAAWPGEQEGVWPLARGHTRAVASVHKHDTRSSRRRATRPSSDGPDAPTAASGAASTSGRPFCPGQADDQRRAHSSGDALASRARQQVHQQQNQQQHQQQQQEGRACAGRCWSGKAPASSAAPSRGSTSDGSMLRHDLAAAWWISLKQCSVRTAVPNRSLLARATGSKPEALEAREVAALIALDWRVHAALRAGGLVMPY